MKELKELGDRVRKLKEENEVRKKTVRELKGERTLLVEKNRYLAEKLKEASIAYSNAGKRVVEFVDTQIKPVKKRLERFDSIYRKISDYEKSVSEGLGKIEGFEDILNSLKTGLFNLEKKQAEFDSNLKELSKQTGRIGDATLRLEGMKIDSKIVDSKVSELSKNMNELKDNFSKSIIEMRDEFRKSIDSLREDVDRLSERKEEKVGRDITAVESELKTKMKEMEKGFGITSRELGEKFGRLGERLAKIESAKAGGRETGERIRGIEGSISDAEARMNEKVKNLSDMVLGLRASKGDWKVVDEKIRGIEKSMNTMKDSFNEGIAKMKEGFWHNLDSLREDVDKLSERKEEKVGKSISDVESELSKRIDEINSNFKELGSMVLKLEGVKTDSRMFDEKVGKLGKNIHDLGEEFRKSIDSLREDVDRLSERKEEKVGRDITAVESELKTKMKEMEKGFGITSRELGEKFGRLGERLAKMESVKVGGKEMGERMRGMEKNISLLKKEFHDSLTLLKKDVDGLSERKEEKLGKSISDVESELNKRIYDVNSNLKDLGEVVFSIKASKGDSKIIDKRIRDLETILNASIVEIRDGFQKSIDSLREDVDRLSERKEEKLGKDISEVEAEFNKKIGEVNSGLKDLNDVVFSLMDRVSKAKGKRVEKHVSEVEEGLSREFRELKKDMNITKKNFDMVADSLKSEIKKGEAVKKDEINRIVREFFGIRAQIEERMKQLTEQFDQLDKFKEEFRKGFEKRVTSSELSVKNIEDNLSRIGNHLKDISERGFVNENKGKETEKQLRESVKNLESKIDSISNMIASIKKESSKELDKLLEEAGG